MTHVECTAPIIKSNLKLLCKSQVYVIIVMNIYFWLEVNATGAGVGDAKKKPQI